MLMFRRDGVRTRRTTSSFLAECVIPLRSGCRSRCVSFERGSVAFVPSHSVLRLIKCCYTITLLVSHFDNRIDRPFNHCRVVFFSLETFSSFLTLVPGVLIESLRTCRTLDNCITIGKPRDRNAILQT